MSARPKLLYIITEDWFFASHFLPMARAARRAGFDISVMCRVRQHRAALESEGLRLLPLDSERRSLNPFQLVATIAAARKLIRAEQPDLVHLIALKPIVFGGIAARLAGVKRRVFALTGTGFLGAGQGWQAKAGLLAAKLLIRNLIENRQTRYLFENRADPDFLGLDPADAKRVTIIGGAGIDPDAFRPAPLPGAPPLRIALVARMLWSKGVDIAVDAVRLARAAGADVTLTLAGAPDASNPKAIPIETLAGWARQPGISWLGARNDIAAIWAAHHLACLPSRGGEGLPRSLLEAAGCGRGILTTAVPGCADFVRDGIEGFVVPAGDAAALAQRIIELAASPQTVTAMGKAARARVLDGYTEAAAGQVAAALYADMMER